MKLKDILATITGGNPRKGVPEPTTAERLAKAGAAMQALEDEKAAAAAAVAAADDRRAALLLEGDAASLREHAETIQAARDSFDAAGAKLEALSRVVADLRKVQRAETVAYHREATEQHFSTVAEAVAALIQANADATAAYEAARAALGKDPITDDIHNPTYFGMANPAGLEAWARWAVSHVPALAGRPALAGVVPPSAVAPAPSAPAKPKAGNGFAGPRANRSVEQRKPERRAPKKLEGPVPDGHVPVTYLRPGVELPGGGVSVVGDEVALPATLAAAVLRNGAADTIPATGA